MKDKLYTQCKLIEIKEPRESRNYVTSWIPDYLARLGSAVALKEDDGSWGHYEVLATYSTEKWEYIKAMEDAHRQGLPSIQGSKIYD